MHIKWILLSLLLCQNATVPIVSRYATTENAFNPFITIVIQELLKLLLSVCLYFQETRYMFKTCSNKLYSSTIVQYNTSLKLFIPALLYFIQNCSISYASSNLPAAVFQVVIQGKTVAVAICSVVILGTILNKTKWMSIVLLFAGLVVVQQDVGKEGVQSSMDNNMEQDNINGLIFVFIGTLCSGLSGVYFEKILKENNNPQQCISLWIRNAQLAFFSILIGCLPLCLFHHEKPFLDSLRSFTPMTWLLVCYNVFGGLLVALVIQHTDNIIKGFITAISTVFTVLISIVLFQYSIGLLFVCGTVMILASTLLYNDMIVIYVPSSISTIGSEIDSGEDKTLLNDCASHNYEIR